MRIFLAGASGVIGLRLVPLLIGAGHVVAGMTRSADKASELGRSGAEPVVCDVYDAGALTTAMTAFRPDAVVSQLTDLPDSAADLAAYSERNARIRVTGTQNLLVSAAAAGGPQLFAQSVSWELPGSGGSATAAYEHTVIAAGGVVLRYGQLFGPGTYYESQPPERPRVHLDDAARQTVTALTAPPGLTLVIDDRASSAAR